LTRVVVRALLVKGMSLGNIGRKLEGIALIEGAGRVAREHGYNEELLSSLLIAGFQKGDTDLQAALQDYRDGVVLARRLGNRNRLLGLINNLGYTGFLAGDWDDALAEMEAALSDELDYKDRILIMCNAAIVHAARGESIDDSLNEVMRLGASIPGEAWHLVHLDPEANRALAEGRLADARRAWHRMAELDLSQANEFLYRAAVPALWTADTAAASGDLAELDATGVHGRVAAARRLSLQAGLAALGGRTAEAVALFGEALSAWRELRIAWDEALTGLTMVRLLDRTLPEVRKVAESTRAILVRLRAKPYLDQLDAVPGSSSEPRAAGTAAADRAQGGVADAAKASAP
jgi:tetratricopeptide (TPR) repeat protein